MTLNDFEQATAIRPGDGPSTWLGDIPDGWQQGKGAFGGVVIGILARAILASGRGEEDQGRALRSLSADLCAPALPGPADVHVAMLRHGGNVSFVDARMMQGSVLVARASAALASARSIPPSPIHTMPPAMPPAKQRPWQDVSVSPVGPPNAPVFTRRFEYRSTGPLPFRGGTEAVAEGWLRERRAPSVRDEANIIGLLDAWWPAVLALETGPRSAATVGYTMQLVVDPRTLDPAEPLFYRARSIGGADNFFIELRELWQGETIVAMNQQTFALLT